MTDSQTHIISFTKSNCVVKKDERHGYPKISNPDLENMLVRFVS